MRLPDDTTDDDTAAKRVEVVRWMRDKIDPHAEAGVGLARAQATFDLTAIESAALFFEAFQSSAAESLGNAPLIELLVRSDSIGSFAYAGVEDFALDDDAPKLKSQTSTVMLGGKEVCRLGLGGMRLVSHAFYDDNVWHDALALPRSPEENRHAFLNAVQGCGINYVDVARGYGPWPGAGESILRDWCRSVDNRSVDDRSVDDRSADNRSADDRKVARPLVTSTKVGYQRDHHGTWWVDLDPDVVTADVSGCIRDFGGHVDLLYLVLRSTPEVEVKNRPEDLERLLAPFIAAKEDGRIGGIGLANATAQEIDDVVKRIDIDAVQNNFNLDVYAGSTDVDKARRDALEFCIAANIPFVMWGIFGEGAPPQSDRANPLLQTSARTLGLTPREASIALLLSIADNVIVLPGASRRETIYSAVRAANIDVPKDILRSHNIGPAR